MNFVLIIAVLFVLFVLRYLWSIGRIYRPLFNDNHFLEFLQLIPGLKRSALEKKAQPFDLPTEPRTALTTKGLRVFYTIENIQGTFLHHLSFSYGGRWMAFAAGGRFLYMMLVALGTLGNLKAVAHTEKGITHGAYVLSEEEQRQFAEKAVVVPNRERIPPLKKAATEWIEKFRFPGGLARSEDELLARVEASFRGDSQV